MQAVYFTSLTLHFTYPYTVSVVSFVSLFFYTLLIVNNITLINVNHGLYFNNLRGKYESNNFGEMYTFLFVFFFYVLDIFQKIYVLETHFLFLFYLPRAILCQFNQKKKNISTTRCFFM